MSDFTEDLDKRLVIGFPKQPQPGDFENALQLEKALANVSRENLDTREGQAQYCVTLATVIDDIHQFMTTAASDDELLAQAAKADVERYVLAAKIMAHKLAMSISAKA
jgi:hypothetical protein